MSAPMGWIDWPRDVVGVTGPDAASYLQSQLTQDLRPLQVRRSMWSFVLSPNGKVDALVRVSRRGDDEFVLDTDKGLGEALLTRLARFKIRVKVDLAPLAWHVIAVRGPGASRVEPSDGVLAAACGWPGIDGLDLIGERVSPPDGWNELGALDFDRMRIEAGWPVGGAELTSSTIPGETGVLALAVSFTKGCYPGQELVERIDSRGGNVARRLRLLRADAFMEPGAMLEIGGKDVGWITSVTLDATDGGTVGLGYVSRAVEPPTELTSHGQSVRVEALAGP